MASVCISRDWTPGSLHPTQALYYTWQHYSEWVYSICYCLLWRRGLTSLIFKLNLYLLYLFFSGFRSVNLQKISLYIPRPSCQAPARTDVILCCQLILMEALWPPICHTATKTWQADGKATFKSPWPNSMTGNTQSGTKYPILSELGSKRLHCTSPLARSQNIKWTGRYFKITP